MESEHMKAAEASAIIREVFGKHGQKMGHTDASKALRRGYVTIGRWCLGITPIRPMEAAFLRLVLALHRQGVNWQGLIAGDTEADEVI